MTLLLTREISSSVPIIWLVLSLNVKRVGNNVGINYFYLFFVRCEFARVGAAGIEFIQRPHWFLSQLLIARVRKSGVMKSSTASLACSACGRTQGT